MVILYFTYGSLIFCYSDHCPADLFGIHHLSSAALHQFRRSSQLQQCLPLQFPLPNVVITVGDSPSH